MWHRRKRHRLGVKTKHRKALLRNLVRGLILHRRIETTLTRAKETSRAADRLVTIAKGGTLAARRLLIARLASAGIAGLLVDEIVPHLREKQGGYTRVLKLGTRPGDGAETALVEFSVPIVFKPKVAAPSKERKPKERKPAKVEKKIEKVEKEKKEKPETEKRGGFLSKLRKFLTGEEEKK